MKQHITKQQWDELSEEEKYQFCLKLGWVWKKPGLPIAFNGVEDVTIGQMIEFLGWKDIHEIFPSRSVDGEIFWHVQMMDDFKSMASELADALWEAVKYKLKH
jgi:hypothetical protein